MATRRGGRKSTAGQGKSGRRRKAAPAPKKGRGGRAGARQARSTAAAREVRAREAAARDEQAGSRPALRLAHPPEFPEAEEAAWRTPGERPADEAARAEDADRAAAELARRIEAAAAGAGEALRGGPASAADQLSRHREQMEEAARQREDSRELPGPVSIGLELAVGALRLARAVVSAPFRIGLALLRRGAPA